MYIPMTPTTGTHSKPSADIIPILANSDQPNEHSKAYKGRYQIWPGIFILCIIFISSLCMMTYFGIQTYQISQLRNRKQSNEMRSRRRIDDGKNQNDLPVHVDDDGEVGNPKKYPDLSCKLPNYVSKNGLIYAEYNEKSIPLSIKGINWFGMETLHGIPFGLWDNLYNGTTVYEIATFLARNKFNSVRLPLSVSSILKNIVPDTKMINLQTNRAINVLNYLHLLKSLIQALGYRRISILLDLHTLTPTEVGEYWYSKNVPEQDVLKAIDILTANLCHDNYWNIIGLDLKNEPHKCTWGNGNKKTDFQYGAQLLGNRMLKGCPQWLTFVEGINKQNTMIIDKKPLIYYDWWGGGLQKAQEYPIQLNQSMKIVWAPHYYSPSVYPASYLYQNGQKTIRGLESYIEFSNTNLRKRIELTMNHMFGYLKQDIHQYAIVLGEFGGIYQQDAHPKKTNQRAIDYTIEESIKMGGGYAWSLNPESGYEYNPADKYGHFQEGLLDKTWLNINQPYFRALSKYDQMKHLKFMPCF